MPFREMDGLQGILLNIWGAVQRGFGELTTQVADNRAASEARHHELQRQITEHRLEARQKFAEIEKKIARVQAPPTSRSIYGSLASALITHWDKVLALTLMAASLFGLVSPEKAKEILGLSK